MDNDIVANLPSVISLCDVTSQSTFGVSGISSGETDNELEKLRNQVRCLESENLGLRRTVPRMRDIDGTDLTDQMSKICKKLAEAEENAEYWETECSKKEQSMNRQRQEFFRQIELKEDEIAELCERGKLIEEENTKLRAEIENDQSRIFRLTNKTDYLEDQTLVDEFHDQEIFSKLRQDLSDKITENLNLNLKVSELEEKLIDLQNKFDAKKNQLLDLETIVNHQNRTIDSILSSGNEAQEIIEDVHFVEEEKAINLNNSYDNDYIVKNALNVFNLLKKNFVEMKSIRQEIVALLTRYNVELNDENFIDESFDDLLSKRHEAIRKRNIWLENEVLKDCGNSALRHHLDELNEDSIASSLASNNHSQFIANADQSILGASFAEILKNTTGIDFPSRTIEIKQDVGSAVAEINNLKNLCYNLFDKLCNTGIFLEHVLEVIGENEEGRKLLEKFKELKLDLDKSIQETQYVTNDLKKAEQSLNDFCDLINQTIGSANSLNSSQGDVLMNQTSFSIYDHEILKQQTNEMQDSQLEILQKELQKLSGIKESYESLKITLKNELELKDVMNKRIKYFEENIIANEEEVVKLKTKIDDLQEVTDGLHHVIDKREAEINEKNQQLEQNKAEIFKLLKINENNEKKIAEILEDLKHVSIGNDTILKELANKSQFISTLEEKIATLRQQNLVSDKSNENLRQQQFELEENFKTLLEKYRETDAIIGKANKILYAKISDGVENVNFDESVFEDLKDDSDSLLSTNEFTHFLEDCEKRANKIVQLLKKSSQRIEEVNEIFSKSYDGLELKIPFYENLITETRCIRMMLHKIARFFDAQKENKKLRKEMDLKKEIRLELNKIYETLESAQNQSKKIKSTIAGK